MPRKSRRQITAPASGLYHIVCRGINQRCIFRAPQDYKKFLNILAEAKKKFAFYLYSYNLLPNHFHLFIEIVGIPISKIMHRINSQYASYFNRRYKRTGHLFQDRFYSSLIDTETYFWAAGAYIDLNAYRAGLCQKPEDYPWSSFWVYLQKKYDEKLIDRNQFLKYGGEGDIEKLRQNYLRFLEKEIEREKRPEFIKSENYI